MLTSYHKENIFQSDSILKWSDTDSLFEIIPKSDNDFRFRNEYWIRSLDCLRWSPALTLCDSACDCTAFDDTHESKPDVVIQRHWDGDSGQDQDGHCLQWSERKHVREFCDENVSEYSECDSDICECCST